MRRSLLWTKGKQRSFFRDMQRVLIHLAVHLLRNLEPIIGADGKVVRHLLFNAGSGKHCAGNLVLFGGAVEKRTCDDD